MDYGQLWGAHEGGSGVWGVFANRSFSRDGQAEIGWLAGGAGTSGLGMSNITENFVDLR